MRLSTQMKKLLAEITAQIADGAGYCGESAATINPWMNRRTLRALEVRGLVSVCGGSVELTKEGEAV